MLEIFQKWYERYFFEEESILLLVLLAIGLVLVITVGDIITPMLAAIVLAYLMAGISGWVTDKGLPQWVGVSFAFAVFMGLFFGFLFLLFLFSFISKLFFFRRWRHRSREWSNGEGSPMERRLHDWHERQHSAGSDISADPGPGLV